MHRVLPLVLVLGCAVLGAQTIAVTPATAQATVGQTVQFAVKVTGTSNTNVVWSVVGAGAGNSTVGIITAKGLYTAPAKVPAPNVVQITATSVANVRAKGSASITVVGPPVIAFFTAAPVKVNAGQASVLSWTVAGATSLSISPFGGVTGTSLRVSPSSTTTYTLTATNSYGSATATATVTAGSPPAIASFKAVPATVTVGQQSTLSWTVTGAASLTLTPAFGLVTGTSVKVTPLATTTYKLTATNAFGSATATATVTAASLPVISRFWATPPGAAGPGISAVLNWTVTGATSLSIDHGVGAVTGMSASVNPTTTTVYNLTATNAAGSVTASVTVFYYELVTVTSQLFYSEHVVFIIPPPGQVAWTGPNSWASVFSKTNIDSYVNTLKSLFPSDYFFVVVAANNLTPNSVPNVLTYRHLADGIGEGTVTGVGIPNICRYNIGGGTVIDGAFGVLDHEIGHNWGVFAGVEVGAGHWRSNSTANGQMADSYTDDGYITVKKIAGDSVNGFTWTSVNNITRNETETFSGQDLYLMGLSENFPDLYVLASPVYNSDQTVSYSAVTKYDQAWVEQRNGVRVPNYQTSPKRLRTGVVYIARDFAEVLAVNQPIERSIDQFVNAEQVDTKHFRFQVPFLVETNFRASLDALLADLDGNATPVLTIPGATYLVSSDGTAQVPFVASDPDKTTPVVSCVPASPNCSINGNNVDLAQLALGTHFFTIKAEDAGGKKAFAHFVVDVQ